MRDRIRNGPTRRTVGPFAILWQVRALQDRVTEQKTPSEMAGFLSLCSEVQKARVKLLLAMGFFRYNDPLQQFIGAIVASIIFVIILKWAFSSNPKMTVLPIAAGKKDQYGLLKPIDAAQMKIDVARAQEMLLDFKIKATVTDTYDGVQLMVFDKDYQKAMRILGQPIEGS